jgi:hypothetical protein
MARQLQLRADDLAESLFVAELEMRRSRTLEQRLQAFLDFSRTVARIDALRRDAEELHADEHLLEPLDRQVAIIMRSPAYRIAEWFYLDDDVRWYVGPATIGPVRQEALC